MSITWYVILVTHSNPTLQLRVSAIMSNSPYILVLDCDMYCNDPTSARQAMCFHLDPQISTSLAFVQFPQKYHNIGKDDIYDSQLRMYFKVHKVFGQIYVRGLHNYGRVMNAFLCWY